MTTCLPECVHVRLYKILYFGDLPAALQQIPVTQQSTHFKRQNSSSLRRFVGNKNVKDFCYNFAACTTGYQWTAMPPDKAYSHGLQYLATPLTSLTLSSCQYYCQYVVGYSCFAVDFSPSPPGCLIHTDPSQYIIGDIHLTGYTSYLLSCIPGRSGYTLSMYSHTIVCLDLWKAVAISKYHRLPQRAVAISNITVCPRWLWQFKKYH